MAKAEGRKDTIRIEASELKYAFDCLHGKIPFRGLRVLSITTDSFDGITAEVEPFENQWIGYPVLHRIHVSNGPDGPVYEEFAVIGG